jgi:hypothetical protein
MNQSGNDLLTVLLSFIVALPGLVGYILQWRRDKISAASEYEQLASRSARRVNELEGENDRLRAVERALRSENEKLIAQIDTLKLGVEILTSQLKRRNIRPEWLPENEITKTEKDEFNAGNSG